MGRLKDLQNQLHHAFPADMQGHQVLGAGKFGVATGDDRVVTKYLRADAGDGHSDFARKQFEREVDILGRIDSSMFDGVEVPSLIKPLEKIDHPDFVAQYTMTRINGVAGVLDMSADQSDPDLIARYKQVGHIAARFQAGVCDLVLPDAIPMGERDGKTIVTPDSFGDDVGARLQKAQDYLQGHIHGANIHGDINIGNVIWHDDQAVGLIDFSFTGFADNAARESWVIPLLNPYLEGYKESSGEDISALVHATNLSLVTQNLAQWRDDYPHTKEEAEAALYQSLGQFEVALDQA